MWGFRHRSFKKNDSIRKNIFRNILLRCGRFLTRINLSKYQDNRFLQSRSTISTIIKFCPNLEDINVTALGIYSSDLQKLAKNYRNLTKLNLGVMYCYCDEELQDLFKANCNLTYLEIRNGSIDFNTKYRLDKYFSCLPQNMHTIILLQCFIENFSVTLKRFENLRHLALKKCQNVPKHIMEAVSKHLKNLTVLELDSNGFSYYTVDSIVYFTNLQILILPFNRNVSDEFLANLGKHCRQLTCLNISNCDSVTDTGLAALAPLLKLEKLNIGCFYDITGDGLQIYGLKELSCANCTSITNCSMSMFIKSSPQLQMLNLARCSNITNITLWAAVDACNSRSNNVMLKLHIDTKMFTSIEFEIIKKTPLLQLVHQYEECKECITPGNSSQDETYWYHCTYNSEPNLKNLLQLSSGNDEEDLE